MKSHLPAFGAGAARSGLSLAVKPFNERRLYSARAARTKIVVVKTKLFVYSCVYAEGTHGMEGRPMPKSRTGTRPARPTDAELEILRVLWRLGPSTVRQVHEVITSGRKQTTFNTTLKLLHIMYGKGLVTREDARRPHVYQPAIPEAQMQQRLVSDLLERAFGGAARKLVAALTATDISDEELADIRRFLNEHAERSDEHAE